MSFPHHRSIPWVSQWNRSSCRQTSANINLCWELHLVDLKVKASLSFHVKKAPTTPSIQMILDFSLLCLRSIFSTSNQKLHLSTRLYSKTRIKGNKGKKLFLSHVYSSSDLWQAEIRARSPPSHMGRVTLVVWEEISPIAISEASVHKWGSCHFGEILWSCVKDNKVVWIHSKARLDTFWTQVNDLIQKASSQKAWSVFWGTNVFYLHTAGKINLSSKLSSCITRWWQITHCMSAWRSEKFMQMKCLKTLTLEILHIPIGFFLLNSPITVQRGRFFFSLIPSFSWT